MKRFRPLAALPLLALLLASCATSPAPLPLRVGLTPNSPPLCMLDPDGTRPDGLECDLATALAAELRCPLEIVPLEWDDLFPALFDGRVDILMSGLTVTPGRAARVAFCDPYLQNPLVAATRAGEAAAYASAADILTAPASIGVLRRTSAETFVRRHCARARAVPVALRRDVAQNLAANRFSLYVDDLAAVLDLAAANPEILEVIPVPLHPQDLAWAVRPDNADLLLAANAALARWRASGRLDALLDRWLPARPK
ncbi:MAG: transporter substrate-binding domain-containing protein [Kiritimatiellae bacterium]|nr:transporter substrate-binding domain-containing protein [Kiritimatiellia bacterium]